MFDRILLPLDGSEIGEMAITYAKKLAGSLGSEIILYHVRGSKNKDEEPMHRGYRNFSADCIKKINGQRAVNDFEIKAGDPTKSICNLLGHKNKIDLIIMSVVNANGLKIGKMLGSVTNHLSGLFPCGYYLSGHRIAQELKVRRV